MQSTYSVSEITSKIKTLLEGGFPRISIVGEISNCSFASSGHLYFTLKDSSAAISAVMFKGYQHYLDFLPKDGQKVIATGSITLYEPRGTYQIRCDSLTLFGTGEILAMLEERKNRLAQTGIFDSDKKKAIPAFPETVAVVTSKTGAALQDILHILYKAKKRPLVKIFPVAVQGEHAAKTLTTQLELINKFNLASLIIVGRGGGSVEDLLPFSDEEFVKAVASSHIPVISAVGHEVDYALCDFAADLRAPTPTAAAQIAFANYMEIDSKIEGMVSTISSGLKNRLDVASARLKNLGLQNLKNQFTHRIENFQIKNDNSYQQLCSELKKKVDRYSHRLDLTMQKISDSSPNTILKRGFVKITNQDNQVILSTKNLSKDQIVKMSFSDGVALSRISEVTNLQAREA